MNFSPSTDAVFTKKSEDGSLDYWTIVCTNRTQGYSSECPVVFLRKFGGLYSEEIEVHGLPFMLREAGFEPVCLVYGGIWENLPLRTLPPYTKSILDWMKTQYKTYVDEQRKA